MRPAQIEIDPWTEGDQWEGLPVQKIRVKPTGGTRAAPLTPMASVVMRFKAANELPTAPLELSSSGGEITILDAVDWSFSVPKQVIAGLTRGKWRWQIRVTDTSTDGSPKTYLEGEIEILERI